MNTVVQIILLLVAAGISIFWMFLYLKGKGGYEEEMQRAEKTELLMKEYYFIGFALLDQLEVRGSLGKGEKIRKYEEVYGKKEGADYCRVAIAGQWTVGLTAVTLGALLAALSGQWVILLLGAVLGGLFVYSIGDAINEILKNRREELMLQFPPVLSQLILLVSSGMVMRDAWKKVAESGQGLLYTEMQKTLTEMNNGVMEIQAYQNFAFRCNVREIRKFSTAVVQNIQKGSKELVGYLRDMSDEMWNAKKAIVKRKGDAAASKLLMPTVLIFIGILFMILAPMLSSMQI